MTQLTKGIQKKLAVMREEDEEFCIVGNEEDGAEVTIWKTDKTQGELEEEYTEYCQQCIEEEKEEPTWDEWIAGNYEELEIEEYDENKDGYLVYTDSEAEDAWENDIDNYIDECVLPNLPESYRNYFDDERFKRDCKIDGRGHSLATYDGDEREQKVCDTWYYLYKR